MHVGRVVRIQRYPVKGLSAEALEQVMLTKGEGLPQDRRFALLRPGVCFDPQQPQWLPKTNFVMLMRDEELAQLQTRFDELSGMLTISRDGTPLLQAGILDAEGRQLVSQFFGKFLKDKLSPAPQLMEAPGHTFSDAQRKPNSSTYKYASLINLASVRALEPIGGVAIDPLRFRANVYVDGPPAWTEFDWIGSELAIGGARLRVVSRTERCAATTVNPATAERDLNIPALLRKAFGHRDMGIYAEVAAGGEIATGAPVQLTA